MRRYVIERDFPGGLDIPADASGQDALRSIVRNNHSEGVTWVHSFVTPDHKKAFCIYDGPSPEAIRRAAGLNDLPVEAIHEVSVLDPYFYLGRST